MGDLYYSKFEIEVLSEVDPRALDAAIERCLDVRNSYALNVFRLDACGPYVASKAREFDAALRAFAGAKAPKKTELTASMARRKGGSLGSALPARRRHLKSRPGRGRPSTCLTTCCLPRA